MFTVRYALDSLRRSPGFFATAVAAIALGIAANTASFDVVNGKSVRNRDVQNARAIAPLKPGGTLADAQQDLHAIRVAYQHAHAQISGGRDVPARPFRENLVGGVRDALLTIQAAARVLFIACTNVSRLLNGRATGYRELAEFPLTRARLAVFGALLGAEHGVAQAPQFAPAPGSPLEVGAGSGTLLFADVNRDGHVDLLTRHLLTRLVTVQLGDGRGGFRQAAGSPVTFTYTPGDMALGDLNKDGIADLVVTPGDRDLIDVLVGTGSGAFTRTSGSPFTVTTTIEPFNKRALHLVDVNEDGNLDTVTANGRRQTTFAVMFGDGRASFSRGPVVELDPGRDGYSFAFGDVDGDGHLDVVNASRARYDDTGPGRVLILIGDGRGGFRRSPRSGLSVPTGPRFVTMGDLNADRRIDAAIAHPGGLVSLLLNDGRGGFSQATPAKLGGETHFFQIADVNRDGKADLIAPTVDSVTVLLGGNGTYAAAAGSPFRAGPGAYHVAIGDINADGRVDLAAASFEGSAVTLLLGR